VLKHCARYWGQKDQWSNEWIKQIQEDRQTKTQRQCVGHHGVKCNSALGEETRVLGNVFQKIRKLKLKN